MDELRKLEIRARELLAAECAKAYAEPFGAPIDSHEIAVRAIVAALAAIPEGWVLVPREATDEMISAGVFAHRNDGYRGMPMHAAWAAMVAASPPLAASRAEQEPQP